MKSTIKLSELLKGCTPGRIQSVGNMQIIPLVSDITNDKFVSPDQSANVSTTGYGTLTFKNKMADTLIVPAQTAYIVKGSVQDHALPHAGLVGGKKTKSFGTAMCVEDTQPGLIKEGDYKMVILPYPLREQAHKDRKGGQYSRLWTHIRKLNTRAGSKGSVGHLQTFLKSFSTQLDKFIAEFEPVQNQVGAIILINGRVIGVERSPNYEFWLSIWSSIIRECYGSQAIIEAKENPQVPKTRVAMRKATSVADLKVALKEAVDEEYDKVKKIVDSIGIVNLGEEIDEQEKDYKIEALDHKRFVGQIIRDKEEIVYVSLVATQEWRSHEDWYEAEPFGM